MGRKRWSKVDEWRWRKEMRGGERGMTDEEAEEVRRADTSGGGRRVKEAGVWERIVGIVVVVVKESETRLVHTNAFVLPTLPKNTTTVVTTIAYQN
ncbi:hypothetical protein Pcinc_032006 [Petrolisthes cinctipes]|uniref:Uncharacterized protein n=1 Tax=Petrolisthes cinctipes TaxID=88211 RepID=A0AAE1EVG6_PETCI|nr:hypothetical protein Pcinc_032006 [Petrolisthes cinctipes]